MDMVIYCSEAANLNFYVKVKIGFRSLFEHDPRANSFSFLESGNELKTNRNECPKSARVKKGDINPLPGPKKSIVGHFRGVVF